MDNVKEKLNETVLGLKCLRGHYENALVWSGRRLPESQQPHPAATVKSINNVLDVLHDALRHENAETAKIREQA